MVSGSPKHDWEAQKRDLEGLGSLKCGNSFAVMGGQCSILGKCTLQYFKYFTILVCETYSHRTHVKLLGKLYLQLSHYFESSNSVTCIDLSVTISMIKSVNLGLFFWAVPCMT